MELEPQETIETEEVAEVKKAQVESLKRVRGNYTDKLKVLDDQIAAIQRSTRTVLPGTSGLHNFARMHFRWYYNWHIKPYAEATHWVILILFGIAVVLTAYLISR